jgi:membrane protein
MASRLPQTPSDDRALASATAEGADGGGRKPPGGTARAAATRGLGDPIAVLHRRIRRRLWPEALPEPGWRYHLLVLSRYLYALLRDLAAGQLSLRAMSLVYTTMLAVVPFLAFSFSLLKGLGVHRQLEPLLLNFLAPLGPQADALSANIINFVDNISGSTLAIFSIAVLLYTALSMAQKVESSFNFVWRVDRPRSFARRFSEYLSVMLVGPLVMSIAMALTAAVSSATLMERLRSVEPLGTGFSAIGSMMPYVLVVAAFAFLYVFVPNTRVRIVPAVVGGVFAGFVWAASGSVFANVVVSASRWEAIYSGFAIVLVAMFWLYLSWLILLLGAQLAYYIQHPDDLRRQQRADAMSNSLRERLALGTMLLVGRDFDEPSHGWRLESLAARMRVPRHHLEPVMAALTDAGLLAVTDEQRLIPARDLRRIRIVDVLDAVRHAGADVDAWQGAPWSRTIDALAQRLESAIDDVFATTTLAELVDRDREDASSERA